MVPECNVCYEGSTAVKTFLYINSMFRCEFMWLEVQYVSLLKERDFSLHELCVQVWSYMAWSTIGVFFKRKKLFPPAFFSQNVIQMLSGNIIITVYIIYGAHLIGAFRCVYFITHMHTCMHICVLAHTHTHTNKHKCTKWKNKTKNQQHEILAWAFSSDWNEL